MRLSGRAANLTLRIRWLWHLVSMSDEVHHPHDKIFRSGFADPVNAAAFLRTEIPPAVSARVDWEKLRNEPGSFVDSQFQSSSSDLLFSAPLGDRECLVYLLFEHQSTQDKWIGLRLLRYMVRIWESCLRDNPTAMRLPVILPVVLAQNAKVWQVDVTFSGLLDIPGDLRSDLLPWVPDFSFRLFQLAAREYSAIHGTPAGILILRTMKAARLDELLEDDVWDEALLLNVPLEIFEMILRYILAADVDKEEFETKIAGITNTQTRSTAMTLAQQYHQEGHQTGLQTGRQEGTVISRQQDVLEALEIRLGHVPAGLREAVMEIRDDARLKVLFRAAIQAKSVEEFAASL